MRWKILFLVASLLLVIQMSNLVCAGNCSPEFAALGATICDESGKPISIVGLKSCKVYETYTEWINSSGNFPILPNGNEKCFVDTALELVESSDTCCPDESECVTDPPTAGDYGMCRVSLADMCMDYQTEEACKGHSQYSADNTENAKYGEGFCGTWGDLGNGCFSEIYCSCVWNASGGICQGQFDNQTFGDPAICTATSGGCKDYAANWDEEFTSQCETGDIVTIHWGSEPWGNYSTNPLLAALCVASDIEYPCSMGKKLPFFTSFNFILSIISIMGIYYFLIKKNKIK
ncbi:MAG: hypothetical protein WC438_00340 [Candidatus Pacearchaeota archaeon]